MREWVLMSGNEPRRGAAATIMWRISRRGWGRNRPQPRAQMASSPRAAPSRVYGVWVLSTI
eukprot:scaffold46657_cov71-Phaeocystis_antarctica.AAC.1